MENVDMHPTYVNFRMREISLIKQIQTNLVSVKGLSIFALFFLVQIISRYDIHDYVSPNTLRALNVVANAISSGVLPRYA